MNRGPYKEFVIEARSMPLRADRWDAEVYIEKHDGQGVTTTQFSIPHVFENEEAAIACALASGRKKSTMVSTPSFQSVEVRRNGLREWPMLSTP